MRGRILRFRIMAFATGFLLLALCGTMIAKYVYEVEHPITIWVPMVHGWLYLLYVLTVIDLALGARWKLGRIILVALAGTIPLASFFAERHVYRTEQLKLEQKEQTAQVS